MVSRNNGNQDLVNGNREGARVVSPNFDLTQGIPIEVIHQPIQVSLIAHPLLHD